MNSFLFGMLVGGIIVVAVQVVFHRIKPKPKKTASYELVEIVRDEREKIARRRIEKEQQDRETMTKRENADRTTERLKNLTGREE